MGVLFCYLTHLTIDHASFSRRRTIPAKKATSNVYILAIYVCCYGVFSAGSGSVLRLPMV